MYEKKRNEVRELEDISHRNNIHNETKKQEASQRRPRKQSIASNRESQTGDAAKAKHSINSGRPN